MAALGIGPAIVAHHANHDAAGELVVAAGLHASDPIIEIMPSERLAVEIAARGAHDPFLALGPQAACVATDIAAGEAPSGSDRRRRAVVRQQIGERYRHGRRQQAFPHVRPLPPDQHHYAMSLRRRPIAWQSHRFGFVLRLLALPMEVIDERHFRQAAEASNMEPG